MSNTPIKVNCVVIGSGPSGYSCAFRLSDCGAQVMMVEAQDIGGVCLNVGCIPSKALLHAVRVVEEVAEMQDKGLSWGKLKVNPKKLVAWQQGVVAKLTGGLTALAKQRKVQVVKGQASFIDAHTLQVDAGGKTTAICFEKAVIAVGSSPVSLPFMPDDPRIFDSTAALQLKDIKGDLLIVGGGIIGLEMATVYRGLGVNVTVVELCDQLIPECDKDVVKPLYQHLMKRGVQVHLNTKVVAVSAEKSQLNVTLEKADGSQETVAFAQILVAVGRRPNGHAVGAEKAGVQVDKAGFIAANKQMRTNIPHIYAIGDVVGNPMLAHKAVPEGRVAAEVIVGKRHYFDPACIPSVAYTDPEVAWVGLTEKQAKEKGIDYGKGVFPWMASGRSLAMCRDEGMTKLLFDNQTGRVIGGAMVGPNAGELIAEVALAIEMGCDVEDIALTVHPHPTLSESVMLAAEMYTGTITDLYVPPAKRRKQSPSLID